MPVNLKGLLWVVGFALSLGTMRAEAAGFRFIEIASDGDGPALHGAIWSPCAEPPGEILLGRTTLLGVKDCAIRGDRLPLVVISHGGGGDFIGHRDTAEALADAGFVVAAVNHPGDTVRDPNLKGDFSVVVERPTEIKRLIDFMLAASPTASHIDPKHVGFFGFSRGGYTGLVLVGATPDWGAAALDLCQDLSPDICGQLRRAEYPAVTPTRDPRIKAMAVADPLAIVLTRQGLQGVTTPIQLWASERAATASVRTSRSPWIGTCRGRTNSTSCRTQRILSS
jgi:predicted dienelactone hydrolase